MQTLGQHQLFGTLSKKELKVIAQEMVLAKPTQPKGYIFQQGDMGTCFFIILEGTVSTEIDGKVIRKLSKGETFGELALLFRSPRTASIRCVSEQC